MNIYVRSSTKIEVSGLRDAAGGDDIEDATVTATLFRHAELWGYYDAYESWVESGEQGDEPAKPAPVLPALPLPHAGEGRYLATWPAADTARLSRSVPYAVEVVADAGGDVIVKPVDAAARFAPAGA